MNERPNLKHDWFFQAPAISDNKRVVQYGLKYWMWFGDFYCTVYKLKQTDTYHFSIDYAKFQANGRRAEAVNKADSYNDGSRGWHDPYEAMEHAEAKLHGVYQGMKAGRR